MIRTSPLLDSRLAAILAVSLIAVSAQAVADTSATPGSSSSESSEPAALVETIALEQIVTERLEGNSGGVLSQGKVDLLSNETDELAVQYKTALHQIDALRIYNKQVEDLVQSQLAEIADLQRQIDEVELAGRLITPLMFEMIEALDDFIALDVPFLLEERTERIASLREIMKRSDVSDAERYRRILEAYQIENEYGRTIEAYSGPMQLEGQARTVDFLRVGRIVLLYQTRDSILSGAWDQKAKTWNALSSEYRTAIRQGFRVARKEAAPDLLRLPVSAPEVAR